MMGFVDAIGEREREKEREKEKERERKEAHFASRQK